MSENEKNVKVKFTKKEKIIAGVSAAIGSGLTLAVKAIVSFLGKKKKK